MKIIATNKKATFDYQISLKLDAGLVLTGPEVKSLRNNSSSIKESYVDSDAGELWLCNCHIKKYESSNEKDNNPIRKRKLLLNNVLILEFDNRGLLVKKEFFNKDQMNKIKISTNETEVLTKKDTFIRSVITSLKHKINDPLGKRTIK